MKIHADLKEYYDAMQRMKASTDAPGAALDDLAEIFRPRPDISEGEAVNFLLDAIADAPDEIALVVSASVGRTPEWFNGLSGEAGEALVLAWWGTNQGFFLRRLARSLLAAIRRGAVSSQP